MATFSYRIGVVSDTHGRLPAEVLEHLAGVDLILHAGDVCSDSILIELGTVATVHAISGNCDPIPCLPGMPMEQRIETPLGRIAMTHGHLGEAPSTNLPQMKRYFEPFDPAMIVYGHSHQAKLDEIDGVWVFNPGTAGQARFGGGLSIGLISGEAGDLKFEHIPLTV